MSFDSLNTEQRIAKIAHDIVGYAGSSPQAQLSLLQDLIIELLPHVERDSPEYVRLTSVRVHTPAEHVNAWVGRLMAQYLKLEKVQATLATMSDDIMKMPY